MQCLKGYTTHKYNIIVPKQACKEEDAESRDEATGGSAGANDTGVDLLALLKQLAAVEGQELRKSAAEAQKAARLQEQQAQRERQQLFAWRKQLQRTTAQQDAAADTQALLSFKHAGNAANTWLDSWSNASSAATSDSSGPCGSGWNQDSSGGNGWFRVQCDRSGGRVIYIHAYDIALVGSVGFE